METKTKKDTTMPAELKEKFAKIKKTHKIERKSVTYSEDDILRVMEALAFNNFNYQKTSRETGVDRKSLRVWHNRRQIQLIQQERKKEYQDVTKDIPLEELREMYERDVIASKQIILKQIVEVLPKCKSPRMLSDTLKAINESVASPEPPKAASQTPADRGSVLNILTNQLNIKSGKNG